MAKDVLEGVAEEGRLSSVRRLTAYQRFLSRRLSGDGTVAAQQICLPFPRDCDVRMIESAWRHVTSLYPVLRLPLPWADAASTEVRDASVVSPLVKVAELPEAFPLEAGREGVRSALEYARLFGFSGQSAVEIIVLSHRGSPRFVIWTAHPVVADATGIALAASNTLIVSQALTDGHPPPVFPVPSQLPRVSISSYASGASVVRTHLEALGVRSLPTRVPLAAYSDRVSPPRYQRLHLLTSSGLSDAVASLALRSSLSVSRFIGAAWALVLSRHCGEGTVTFGLFQRDFPGDELVNDFRINRSTTVLPFCIDIDEQMTIEDLATAIDRQFANLCGLDSLAVADVDALAFDVFERGLLSTAVDYCDAPTVALFSDAVFDIIRGGSLSESPPFSVVLRVAETTPPQCELVFDNSVLEVAAADRILRSFQHTLELMAADFVMPLSAITVVPPEDVITQLLEWNDTARPFSTDLTVYRAFEQTAARVPDAIAVECSGKSLTYRELDGLSNGLAKTFRDRGVCPGQSVGVCLGRGLDTVVAVMSVAKTRAVYVPLDPGYPQLRLDAMVASADVMFVVADAVNAGRFFGAEILPPSADLSTSGRSDEIGFSGDVFCMFFTSGTTGIPNAVRTTHRSLVNTLEWVNRTFHVRQGDRLLWTTSLSFDLSIYDVFGTLAAGATIVVAPDEAMADPIALLSLIDEEYITIWDSVPASLARLISLAGPLARSASLRLVLLSGDWIPLRLPRDIRSLFPGAEVVGLGGATEASIWSNWYRIGDVDQRWTSIPYGRPIDNCQYYILDERLRPVPIGASGDLFIGGECLAVDYFGNPALTRARFLTNPFGNGRIYRTGDRARYFSDGNVELLGRSDLQVKIRGYRVELGEVESCLRRLPGVKDAVCAGFTDSTGERALAGYVVLEPGISVTAVSIRRELSLLLPPYMVPSSVEPLDQLPLNANGKVDRNILRPKHVLHGRLISQPETALERRMVQIWEDVLGKRPLGVTDDFFDLGGHSLTAVAVVARCRSLVGIELSLEHIVEHRSIRKILSARSVEGAAAPSDFICFNPRGRRIPIVLFPEVSGSLLTYRDLPASLGSDQPVFFARSIAESGSPLTQDYSVERIADIYEEAISRHLPNGPLLLGGFSFGSLVAFELFHRLRRRGRLIPLVVNFDGYSPGYPVFLPIAARIRSHASEAWTGRRYGRRVYWADRVASAKRRLYRRLGLEYRFLPEGGVASADVRRRINSSFRLNSAAARAYRPAFVEDGDMLLFRARDGERWVGTSADDDRYGWGRYINGRVLVVELEGSHMTILSRQNHRSIAEALGAFTRM